MQFSYFKIVGRRDRCGASRIRVWTKSSVVDEASRTENDILKAMTSRTSIDQAILKEYSLKHDFRWLAEALRTSRLVVKML